jgi:hypothetical protein
VKPPSPIVSPLPKRRIYIAGPMRGVPLFNFPAFDSAAAAMVAIGDEPVSPADLDRASGFDPATLPSDFDWSTLPDGFDMVSAMERDIEALRTCHAVYMLDGWQDSRGARAEKALAEWMGLEVLYQTRPPLAPAPRLKDVILSEAATLVHGDRQTAYGHPRDDFARTAKIWEGILGVPVEPHQVALCMMGVKMSRLCKTPHHRDSWVDAAGYAETGAMCVL